MKSWQEEDIKALAHSIWEKQGRPEGRDLEHWQEAEEQFRARWFAEQGEEHPVRDLWSRGTGA